MRKKGAIGMTIGKVVTNTSENFTWKMDGDSGGWFENIGPTTNPVITKLEKDLSELLKKKLNGQ